MQENQIGVSICKKDRWGFDDSSNTWQFTINIGVTWGDYAMCLFNEVCDFPLENSCPIRTRIGNFIGKEQDKEQK